MILIIMNHHYLPFRTSSPTGRGRHWLRARVHHRATLGLGHGDLPRHYGEAAWHQWRMMATESHENGGFS